MGLFVLQVALPDRPGALGAVASRIAAVRANVVAIEIVGGNDRHALDEFVIDLPDERDAPLLLSEVAEVDGVQVEELHPLPHLAADHTFEAHHGLQAYDTALALLAEDRLSQIPQVVAQRAVIELLADWALVSDASSGSALASAGDPGAHPAPNLPDAWPGTVAEVALEGWGATLAVGRGDGGFALHERRRLGAIGRLADARARDLTRRHDASCRS